MTKFETKHKSMWQMIELPEIMHNNIFDIYPDKEESVKFMKAFADGRTPEWCVYLHGDPGCGKSMLACATIKYYMLTRQYPSAIFLTCHSYFKKIQDNFNDNIALSNLMDKLEHIGLLVLDDLGTTRGTEWQLEKIYDLLESRYNRGAKTIITSNWNIETFKEKTSDRLYRRVKEGRVAHVKKSEWHGQVSKDVERPRIENLSKPVQPHQYKDDDGI